MASPTEGWPLSVLRMVVVGRSHFNAGHVVQAHDLRRGDISWRAVDFLDDDVAELLGRGQPAERVERQLERPDRPDWAAGRAGPAPRPDFAA